MAKSVILRVYDSKGHTVLKKAVLSHLKAKKGDLLIAELKDDGSVSLRLLKKEEVLPKLTQPENEEEVLKERTKLRYDLY